MGNLIEKFQRSFKMMAILGAASATVSIHLLCQHNSQSEAQRKRVPLTESQKDILRVTHSDCKISYCSDKIQANFHLLKQFSCV